MDIQFHRTEADYVSAQTAWLLRHPLAIGRSIIPLAGLALALVIVPIRFVLHRASWQELLAVLAWTGWPVLSYFWVRRRWRKIFAKSHQESVDVSATIDERGVTLSSQGEQKTHAWVGFSRIYESSRVVVLEKGDGDFIYLPKRAMNAGQRGEFQHLASSAATCKVRLASPLA